MQTIQNAIDGHKVTSSSARIAPVVTAELPAGAAPFKEGDSVRLIWPKSAMVTMEDGA